jgi:hypothetical protein
MLPQLGQVEQHEERSEGTAEFVGVQCGIEATGGGTERTVRFLQLSLAEPKPALVEGRPSKGRAYAVGASLALILDRLGVLHWRTEVERGAALDEVLARTIRVEPSRAESLEQEAFVEFKHSGLP